ncbi:MAG: LysM peptidoglycan-binding domain-containing protein [Candidatus Omnitrophica bacterium]|nr:LysM peptidoglycan-binding domain-containing protein [Candidatus Omnitrophota bacterium]
MKYHISSAVLLMTVFCLSGCVTKGRFYAVDRPREDQTRMGNAGYIGGERKDNGNVAARPTRRIYVFEFDKKKAAENAKRAETSVDASSTTESSSAIPEPVMPPKEVITIPYIGDQEPKPSEPVEKIGPGMLYSVTKDDTLQKISKKVYGTFGKWTKIYDANKDKIKNPNFVKPGTVLEIPPAE